MNEKIVELKEWSDKNVDTNEGFDDELLEKQFELEEMINEEDFEMNCEWSCYSSQVTILVNDEELEMDEEEKKSFMRKKNKILIQMKIGLSIVLMKQNQHWNMKVKVILINQN